MRYCLWALIELCLVLFDALVDLCVQNMIVTCLKGLFFFSIIGESLKIQSGMDRELLLIHFNEVSDVGRMEQYSISVQQFTCIPWPVKSIRMLIIGNFYVCIVCVI